jgi:23S rRNA pseudouridine2605 synthase
MAKRQDARKTGGRGSARNDGPKRSSTTKPAGNKKRASGQDDENQKPTRGKSDAAKRPGRPSTPGKRPTGDRQENDRPARSYGDAPKRTGRPAAPGKRPTGDRQENDRPARSYGDASKRTGRPSAPGKRPTGDRQENDRPARSYGDSPKRTGRPSAPGKRPTGDRYDNDRPAREGSDKPQRSAYRDERPARDGGKFDKKPYQGKSKPFGKPEVKKKESPADDGIMRLNRYIANSGKCSRREADVFIKSGAVTVNGKVVTELGSKVNLGDIVALGGETLVGEKPVYVLLNKPKGYITTTDDPKERRTVMMLVASACKERIYPVGRLDRTTMGLLLFTNDGVMAKKLTHPGSRIPKLYQVELDKNVKIDDLRRLLDGLPVDGVITKVTEASYVGASKKIVGIQLHSGKNRIVRKMFETMGYAVVKLDRSMFAGLTKKDLPRGRYRHLTEQEIAYLKML